MALGKTVIRPCMEKMSYRLDLACYVDCRNMTMSRALDGHTMVNYVRCGNGDVGCNNAATKPQTLQLRLGKLNGRREKEPLETYHFYFMS